MAGWSARRPGNRQREPAFVAVLRWVRLVGKVEQEGGEGLGDWGGRVAEPEVQFVVLEHAVVKGETDDPGDGLGVEEHEAGRDPGG